MEPTIRENVRGVVYGFCDDGCMRFLLLKTRKGYWQNPQGGKDGLDGISALRKEIKEETNLDTLWVNENSRVEDYYPATRNGKPILVNLSAYAALADPRQEVIINLHGDGHTDYGWFTYEECLSKFNETDNNKELHREILGVMQEVCLKAYIHPDPEYRERIEKETHTGISGLPPS